MEKIIRKLRNEIKLWKKEYNELNKNLEKMEDFYYNHEGKTCEDLIKGNFKLRYELEKEKRSHRWSLEYLCLLIYTNLIDVDKYNKVCKDELLSYNSLQDHLEFNPTTNQIFFDKYENYEDKLVENPEINIEIKPERKTYTITKKPINPLLQKEIVLHLTPDIIKKVKNGELNETK